MALNNGYNRLLAEQEDNEAVEAVRINKHIKWKIIKKYKWPGNSVSFLLENKIFSKSWVLADMNNNEAARENLEPNDWIEILWGYPYSYKNKLGNNSQGFKILKLRQLKLDEIPDDTLQQNQNKKGTEKTEITEEDLFEW